MSTRRLRRGFAAALSAVALLSAAARPLLTCEMAAPVAETAAAAAPDAHSHHAMPGAPAAPSAPDSQRTLGCDHLIGCAVMVVSVPATIAFVSASTPDDAPISSAERHDAPVRAVEPPPPRA